MISAPDTTERSVSKYRSGYFSGRTRQISEDEYAPVYFLTDRPGAVGSTPAAPVPVPRTDPREPVVLSETSSVQPQRPQHGIWWFLLFVGIILLIAAQAYFADKRANADEHTTRPETPTQHQRNLPAYDTDAIVNGAVIVRKPSGGVVCPTSSSPTAPFLYGVQTDPRCLGNMPGLRR